MSEICWDLVKNGDKDEVEKTVEKYYKVGYKIAHWWARTGSIEESEAIGLANIAIMKCITKGSYDETRGVAFSSYLGAAVHNEIRMFLRKERKIRANVALSLDQPLFIQNRHKASEDPYELLTYGDTMLDSMTLEDVMEDKILLEDAHQILVETSNDMSMAELRCIIMYLLGASVKEISNSLKRSQNHSRKILGSAQEKLRAKCIEKNGY
jgi:RNA polymerase sigma factor (sigma-70 family)